MEHRRFILPALILASMLLMSPTRDTGGVKIFPAVPHRNLHNAVITTLDNGKTAYRIADLSYQKNREPYITDLALSFNRDSRQLTRDETGKYRIRSASYDYVPGMGSLGPGCGKFFKTGHGVTIETVRNLWLGSCDDLGSFTVEIRFQPITVKDNSILFTRVGCYSGVKRGIEMKLENGRAVASLYGIFRDSRGLNLNVHLARGPRIEAGRWYHVSISFDRISGKLAAYHNGNETEVRYMTETGDPSVGVYEPSFGYRDEAGNMVCCDAVPAKLGINYTGLIDEFRIATIEYPELERRTDIANRNYTPHGTMGRVPYNVEGIVTSPVHTFDETGTRITLFKWGETIRKHSFIWMQVRTSDTRFDPHETRIKWYRVNNGQRNIHLKKINGEYLRGRYYQWRAHLVASPDGKQSPDLYDVELHYRLDIPPDPPLFVETVSAGSRKVTIRWKKNVEADMLGYRIYYGTEPGKYDGVISRINGRRITNGLSEGNFIEVTITPGLIEENRSLDRRNLLAYPLLENTVLYFFAVSAYDSYKPDTPHNHESRLSKAVTARPFAGSEID